MRKAVVIGCPGAGKSTFARRLRDATGLPLYYLDMLWHRPDRTNLPKEEFDKRLEGVLKKGEWIIDGNYLRTLERRIQKCDTVFMLDYPLETCLFGAESRIGQKREDLPWMEEGFDPEFRQWILDFPEKQLPEIYQILEKYKGIRDIFVFQSREDADRYFI